jgi:phage shock protein E
MKAKISMSELKKHVDHRQKTEVVLDVRSPEEFAEGHIPGSLNIPHEEVARKANELKKYDTVYIHCRSGGRAQIAAAELEKHGVKNLVCVVGSGMPDWIAAGYPVER